MTVKELIEWLNKQPPDTLVYLSGSAALTKLKQDNVTNVGWGILIKD